MQEELTENAKNFGKEIAMLKLRVAVILFFNF
jgi:hypothetical protein